MRYGENALNVISGIKKKLQELQFSLPDGVQIIPTYDRSGIIKRAIETLREKLIEESIVVALVCIVFLWHVRSALVAIITLPIAIILSFVPLFLLGQTSNIMSLGGIAIAIGAMIDAAIIMVENGHKALEHFREKHNRDPDPGERAELLIGAAKAVGRPLFFSLLVITVSPRSDLKHHWVDHQPDEHRNRNIDVRIFPKLQSANLTCYLRQESPESDSDDHAAEYPKREIALEEVESLGLR
jgi:copper/silver efflux system protein